ncbi:hypothetical protein MCEMRE196_01194 [Candidatus Nanopelagicaceae bacterium]
MKKKVVALLLITLTLGSFTQLSAADLPDEQKQVPRPPVEQTGGYSGAYYDDQRTLFRAFTYLESWPTEYFSNGSQTTCSSMKDEACATSNYLFYETPISPCSNERVKDCVVSLSGKNGEGEWINATLVETTTSSFSNIGAEFLKRYFTPFTGDASRGIPDSGSISIWKIPGMTHAGGGDEYLLIPKLNGDHLDKQGKKASNLDVGIFPISKSPSAGKNASDCFMLTDSYCLVRWAHPNGSSFKVSVKTSSKIIGWFHGRIYEPTISSEKLSDGQTLITIEGAAMKVPVLAAWAKNTELPKALDEMIEKEFIERGRQFAGSGIFGGNETDRAKQAVIDDRNPSFDENFFARYLLWVEVAKDKAYANPSTWSFRTMENYAQYEKCIGASGVAGMVTTNSNAYIAGPPVFKDGVLSYKVSSPHYDSKNEIQVGTYDLAIRSDIARCIYGFTSAPIQASVSIIYDDGQTKSATTVVSERNGWLKLSAKGFTYSSPTLKVSFTQEKSASEATINPVTKPSKKTIVCTKGKTTKKVTAVNPKCPSGYKKKA